MKEKLLSYICCPLCAGDLNGTYDERKDLEVMSGELKCVDCLTVFPIRNGIPRFVNIESEINEKQRTAHNFGEQWLIFNEIIDQYRNQFLDWISPVTPDFIRDKVVLEAGCGKGRHSRLIGEWGARECISVDLSNAVEAAYQNNVDLPNVHIIQADIYKLPVKKVCDYAFSVGVLHHLPDPRAGFDSMLSRLKNGGSVSAWIYGRENNGWIINIVNPIRKHFTSRLSPTALFYVSYIPTIILYTLLKTVYAPLKGSVFARKLLFYFDYMTYISKFPFREIHGIVHDHLNAPTAFYISHDEFKQWFLESPTERYSIFHHNSNSWRGFGYVKQ